jgi:hypothetical protein
MLAADPFPREESMVVIVLDCFGDDGKLIILPPLFDPSKMGEGQPFSGVWHHRCDGRVHG